MRKRDRSHPQLRALDAWVEYGLTYARWQDDVKEAERQHVKNPSTFNDILAEILRKQAIHIGDRSHPQLLVLDALVASGITYSEWREDVKEAENCHLFRPLTLDAFLAEMQRKQAMHIGDRSHQQLIALDTLVDSGLSYDGWETDVKQAERHHVKNPSIFDGVLAEMSRKQAIHIGDRSHPQIRALDALVASGLTYAGWQADVKQAESYHIKYPSSFDSLLTQMFSLQRAQQAVSGLVLLEKSLLDLNRQQQSKQRAVSAPQSGGAEPAAALPSQPAHREPEAATVSPQKSAMFQREGGKADTSPRQRTADSTDADDGEEEGRGARKRARGSDCTENEEGDASAVDCNRLNPQLDALVTELDALVASGLTYAGWQDDVQKADRFRGEHPSAFGSILAAMSRKQAIHIGDRSDPQLRALDALVACGLTYAGWQIDVKEAQIYHVKTPSAFDSLLAQMREKQRRLYLSGHSGASVTVGQRKRRPPRAADEEWQAWSPSPGTAAESKNLKSGLGGEWNFSDSSLAVPVPVTPLPVKAQKTVGRKRTPSLKKKGALEPAEPKAKATRRRARAIPRRQPYCERVQKLQETLEMLGVQKPAVVKIVHEESEEERKRSKMILPFRSFTVRDGAVGEFLAAMAELGESKYNPNCPKTYASLDPCIKEAFRYVALLPFNPEDGVGSWSTTGEWTFHHDYRLNRLRKARVQSAQTKARMRKKGNKMKG